MAESDKSCRPFKFVGRGSIVDSNGNTERDCITNELENYMNRAIAGCMQYVFTCAAEESFAHFLDENEDSTAFAVVLKTDTYDDYENINLHFSIKELIANEIFSHTTKNEKLDPEDDEETIEIFTKRAKALRALAESLEAFLP